VPKLKGISFETAIIERYRRRESSVEEALIEMYLAGVSVRRVEDITEALWGSKVSPATISELNKKAYVHIEDWRNRPLQGGRYPYVYVDGIYLRRNWGGEFENVAILVAIAVNEDGYREVLGAAEGMKEDKSSWVSFFQWLRGRGLDGVKLVVGDKACTHQNQRENDLSGEFQPLLIGDAAQLQGGHERAGRGEDVVGKAVAQLEGGNHHLLIDAQNIGQGLEHGEEDERLSAGRDHEEVERNDKEIEQQDDNEGALPLEQGRQGVDDGVHHLRLLHQQIDGSCHADDDDGGDHGGGALDEVHADLAGVDAVDDGHDHRHDDIQAADVLHVPAELYRAHGLSHKGQQQNHQGGDAAGGHGNPLAHDLLLLLLLLQEVGHDALGGGALDLAAVGDQEEGEHHEAHQEFDEPEAPGGENADARQLLADAGGKDVEGAGGKADTDAQLDNAHAHNPVIAQRQGQAGHHGDKGQGVLAPADHAQDTENEGQEEDDHNFLPLCHHGEPLKPRRNGARLLNHVEHAGDHHDGDNDVGRLHNSVGDGVEEVEEGNGILIFHIAELCGIHGAVGVPDELSAGDEEGHDGNHQHDANQDNHHVGQLEGLLFLLIQSHLKSPLWCGVGTVRWRGLPPRRRAGSPSS